MSEIRSISEGSFVLGDTNNLTFEAGPGISISEPSEGTVRIANDETVLFENSTNSNVDSCTLSESITGFERFKIFTSTINDSKIVNEFNAPSARQVYDVICPSGNNQPVIKFVQFTVNGTSLTVNRSAAIFFSNYSGSPMYRYSNSDDIKIIYKVVGINRIGGSNE